MSLIVDCFAGGGGASLGIEMALGRSPDIAINHDADAIAMHAENHPATRHLRTDVWEVEPQRATRGRRVDLAWFSPDCRHFSKAKGGKPVSPKVRSLAWVVVRWAKEVRPRVIFLENVEEFATWGPLGPDGRPCPLRKGFTFRRWCRALQKLGYVLDMRELRACDYGAPTIRNRLFIVARCDGQPIQWPAPTHGPSTWRTAAECIDWSLAVPSIFDRPRPLAEATQRRIAHGLRRYVLEHPRPFLVPLTHHGDRRTYRLDEPFRTVTGAHRGEQALVTPYISKLYGTSIGSACGEPLHTVTAGGNRGGGHHALVAPLLTECANASSPRCNPADAPLRTICANPRGGHHALVTAWLAQHNGGTVGHDCREPVSTISSRGSQQQLVLAGMDRAGGRQPMIRAWLAKYYGTAVGQDCRDPLHSLTTKARFGLVTAAGSDFEIADIGMRMLAPRELFRAQGFPDSYQIDVAGLTKTAQIRLVGNSVCPPIAAQIVAVNCTGLTAQVA